MGKLYPIKSNNANSSSSDATVHRIDSNFDYPLTDVGNAERLISRFGNGLRYCKAKGWLVYDGRRWKRDDTEIIHRHAATTAWKMAEGMADITDDEMRSRLAIHARKSQSWRAINAMVSLAQSHVRVAIHPCDLDSDQWLLNLMNGTIDLRSGTLRAHRPSDLLTKLSPVEYDPRAYCPLWLQFLTRVQPDSTVRGFLQRFVGYALTGIVRDHALPINYGGGRNGKSVFIDTLLYIMGDYAKQIPTELLTVKRGDSHPTDRATLLGCRFAAAVETEQERALNVALVKQLTGGDRISARFMRQDFFEFEPTHKLMLSTNHRPVIRETKNAIWDRVLLISWAITIPEKEQDKELKEKLKGEASGILRWAVEGCLAWQREGLNPPDTVKAATAQYREGQDFLAGFIEECCSVAAEERERTTSLYQAYRQWSEANGEPIQSLMAFGDRLAEMGFTKYKSNGLKFYRGLGLRRTPDSAV
jgi:putative DNA primase/helicase